MKPVTTTVRVPDVARALGAVGLVICAVSVAAGTERVMVAGVALGALFGTAAIVAYVFAPKRRVVLLDIRGDELHVTSRTDPMEIGRSYRPSVNLPIRSIREVVSSRVYLGNELGHFVVVALTRLDGTVENLFFPGELRDEIHEIFRQLEESWPNVEFTDDGYRTRMTWRSWRSMIRPLRRPGRTRADQGST